MDNFVTHDKAMHRFISPQTPGAPQAGPAMFPAPQTSPPLSHDDIARRAYDIYDKKGRQEGRCCENWSQAEQELKSENPASFAMQETYYEEVPPRPSDFTLESIGVFGVSFVPPHGRIGATRGSRPQEHSARHP